jgi:hypothetical protein
MVFIVITYAPDSELEKIFKSWIQSYKLSSVMADPSVIDFEIFANIADLCFPANTMKNALSRKMFFPFGGLESKLFK